jgi:hypothetical protein
MHLFYVLFGCPLISFMGQVVYSILTLYVLLLHPLSALKITCLGCCILQNVGFSKLANSKICQQEVYSNGHVLDNIFFVDTKVVFNPFLVFFVYFYSKNKLVIYDPKTKASKGLYMKKS